ncbi:MAG: pectate lyase [Verrucomicrobiota bacterium]
MRPALVQCFLLLASVLLFSGISSRAATWYVATNGLDGNAGSIGAPFATIMRAQSAASSGDTVFLRGGNYYLDLSDISFTNNPWRVVNNISKSGISYLAYSNELPVFDFSAVLPEPPTNRVTAFRVAASRCVFRGFDVVGVPIVILTNGTQSECFRVDGGSQNLFERLRMHDGHGIGFYLTDGASNLVLNCDAYNNSGVNANSHGNIDGFGFHAGHTTSVSNVIRGCRAWFNSDDGYDFINNKAAVVMENCWALYSGYFTNFTSTGGDANGFKAGGYGITRTSINLNYPTPVPRNVIRFCLAVRNRASGFYANHHPDGLDWINNTAYRNGTDYNMLCNSNNVSGTNDCPGYNHHLRNNVGHLGSKSVSNLDSNRSDIGFNYFTLPVTVSAADFLSLDESLLTSPRDASGNLPYLAFAQLVGASELVDAGTNAGFAFAGSAPDLGAFEYGGRPPPTFSLQKSGTNLIFTSGLGPAGGTNYLLAATNAALPMSQWARIGTNQFSATGGFVITNGINAGASPRFYRLGLP